MNTHVPAALLEEVHRVAQDLGESKTAVVVALLNEGLDIARERLKGHKRSPVPRVPTEKQCKQPGCTRRIVAKSLCAAHYQRARRKPSK